MREAPENFLIANRIALASISASPMNERYLRWWTPHMNRDFEMLVLGDARGLPLVLFPTWNYSPDMLPYYLSTI